MHRDSFEVLPLDYPSKLGNIGVLLITLPPLPYLGTHNTNKSARRGHAAKISCFGTEYTVPIDKC